MNPGELDKETYRSIIETYFHAFGTGDFSQVRFSSQIKFLSPISGVTMDGREAVTRFVSGVSTRVKAVNIISTAVDFPNASGVWQMTTTKGVLYTLHNFFRIDGEGLAYIWPMFDPKAVMDDPPGLLQWLRGEGYYEVAVRTPKQPAGVAISKTGRIFVNFPRWVDVPTPSVAEVAADGSLVPYPNEALNAWDERPGESARNHFVCVQSVVVDDEDNLWILDPASPLFSGTIEGGPKLLKINLATNAVERVYHFDEASAPAKSYLNDVRFAKGHAFISDSGLGAIVVVNFETGTVRRLLEDHASTKAEPNVEPVIGGNPWKFADNTTPQVHSDGIAIDPKREYVYYKALTGRTLYRVTIEALLDESRPPESLGSQVERVVATGPTDGLEFDQKGNLYMTALETNSIDVLRCDGRVEFFARATDFLWPDTITLSRDGDLLFTATQFHLMPAFNGDVDKRTPPYKIFRLKIQEFARPNKVQDMSNQLHPPRPISGPLGLYWERGVHELVSLPIPELTEAQIERHRFFCLLLAALMTRYWNGNKRGESGVYPWREKQRNADGEYLGGDYLGHNIACLAVDAEGEVIDFDFNHNEVFSSSVEHAESRLVRRIFSLTQLNNGWATRDVLAPAPPVPYANVLNDVSIYTSLESCSQCSGIMALGSVREVVFLQRDPGQSSIGNILRNLSPANARYQPPLPIPGDALGLRSFDELNERFAEFETGVASKPFHIAPDGKADRSPSITSFLCTDEALALFREGQTQFDQLETAEYPDYVPLRNDGSPAPGALTNQQVITHIQRFFMYASVEGRRGTPHKL